MSPSPRPCRLFQSKLQVSLCRCPLQTGGKPDVHGVLVKEISNSVTQNAQLGQTPVFVRLARLHLVVQPDCAGRSWLFYAPLQESAVFVVFAFAVTG